MRFIIVLLLLVALATVSTAEEPQNSGGSFTKSLLKLKVGLGDFIKRVVRSANPDADADGEAEAEPHADEPEIADQPKVEDHEVAKVTDIKHSLNVRRVQQLRASIARRRANNANVGQRFAPRPNTRNLRQRTVLNQRRNSNSRLISQQIVHI